MPLKDDGETGEESIERAVEDRDVDGKEENNGLRYEKHYESKGLESGNWKAC